jgi:hypothetical protein
MEQQVLFIDTRIEPLNYLKGYENKNDSSDVTICSFRDQKDNIKPIKKWIKSYCADDTKPIYYEYQNKFHLWK